MGHIVRKNIILVISLLVSGFSFAQLKNVGVPDIQNFTKKEYEASTQNWQIEKNSKNFMYFANNSGLLEYDGAQWHLYSLPNQSIIRSIKVDENDRIYIGQQNDFGYMEADDKGELQYHSLKDLVPAEDRNFEEIWRIHITNFGVVFQSYTHLFIYRDGHIFQAKVKNRLRFSFYVNGQLWVQDEVEGLQEYRQGQFHILSGFNLLNNKEIWSILPIYNNRVLIGTANNGVYIHNGESVTPWKGEANDFLINNQIFSATKFKDVYYAFGTIQNGLMITDETGKIIQHINKKKGLQNNTILSIGTDQDENIWLGLDNGIDYIDINSPFTFMYDTEGLGSTYTSLVHDGKLYVGTNHGLFVKDWPEKLEIDEKGFRLIPKTVGQVWYLGVHHHVILCGHDNGAYVINDEAATQISDIKGGWIFMEPIQNDNYLIGGNYSGLTLFKLTEDQKSYEFVGQIKGFDESSKLIAQDENGVLWMSHGFKGVFEITLNEQLDSVTNYVFHNSKDGLPDDIYNNLMVIGTNILYATPSGIYVYNEREKQFERSAYYNNIFGENNSVDYLVEDQYGNIWFTDQGIPGVLRFQEDGTYTKVIAPFEKLSGRIIAGFQHINVVDMQNTFITLEDGLAHYTPSYQSGNDIPFKTFLREIINQNDGKAFYPALVKGEIPIDSLTFNFKGNNLKFTYSSPDYKNNDKIRYSYFLENYNSEWTDWSEEASCDFMNLKEGEYIFKVKAINPYGNESTVAALPFYIQPPWYRSILAYIMYTLSGLILIGLLIWWVYHRMQVSRRQERLKHLQEYRKKVQHFQREALISEKEIIKLRNDQLRGKMIHLDKELANQTMSLVQKNKFMGKLKSELRSLQGQVSDSSLKSKISLIINRIDKEFDDKKQKELFETYFDEVHEDFFKRLSEKFPSLTPREQKLCAYIKMNISTKEIATLQNISVRGIEISRYRLRKKLNIDRDTNLGTFISNI
ncbi:triple tyrosine motif-containing protein [Sunxiuqinia sp. A32]|uniref:triple tyrosine motif-containing protein n=1 Tax=Sunxiuqinia sp. A32 TaxID=3461496 RepID=UPI004045B491